MIKIPTFKKDFRIVNGLECTQYLLSSMSSTWASNLNNSINARHKFTKILLFGTWRAGANCVIWSYPQLLSSVTITQVKCSDTRTAIFTASLHLFSTKKLQLLTNRITFILFSKIIPGFIQHYRNYGHQNRRVS